jgi:hypothetical protein
MPVVLGLPSWSGGVDPATQRCLDKLFYYNLSLGIAVPIIKATSSLIADNRNGIIRAALRLGAKHVLLVDTDMVFPDSAIQQMIAHKKPIVSAVAHSKVYPYIPNMYSFSEPCRWEPIIEWNDGELLRVDCVGGAFMLIELDAIKHLSLPLFSQPVVHDHFIYRAVIDAARDGGDVSQAYRDAVVKYPITEGLPLVLGEDYYFCDMMRRAGIPIYVDTNLKIGHVGNWTFSYHEFDNARKSGCFDHLKKVSAHDA